MRKRKRETSEKSEICAFHHGFHMGGEGEERTMSKMKKRKQGMTPDEAPGLAVGIG